MICPHSIINCTVTNRPQRGTKRSISLLFVSFLLLLGSSTSTLASPTASSEELGNIINLAGKQRMLTQKMSKEVLLIALGYKIDDQLNALKKTRDLFDLTLNGLEKGNSELGLPATTNPRILRQLGKVDKKWQPLRSAVDSVIETKSVDQQVISSVAQLNLPLLKEMNKAVLLYERSASDGALQENPALATAINLAGKQRMLSQKLSKEFLLIALNHDTSNNKLNLLDTTTLFDDTLEGLKVGNPSLGLEKTESPEILDQLSTVTQLWKSFKPMMDYASNPDNTGISKVQIEQVAEKNLPLLREMNKAVGMYEQLAK